VCRTLNELGYTTNKRPFIPGKKAEKKRLVWATR
jgi:hypothetical protein